MFGNSLDTKKRKKKPKNTYETVCPYCDKPINLLVENETTIVNLGSKRNKFTHIQCYIDEQAKIARDKIVLQRQFTINSLNTIKREKMIENNEKDTQKIKDEIKNFVMDNYNLTFATGQFTRYLDSIFDGTNKRVNKPIPPEDYLYLLKTNQNNLRKIHFDRLSNSDEDWTGLQLFYYDSAIILSTYDKYLKAKQNTEIESRLAADMACRELVNEALMNYQVGKTDYDVTVDGNGDMETEYNLTDLLPNSNMNTQDDNPDDVINIEDFI